MSNQRINYLDGHRGLAILLVIFFHAFYAWSEILPYQDSFAEFPLFKFGSLGVQLFFLLSGFVILMTLEKCNTVTDFIYQRWLRLFPAMLICSIVIFFSSGFFFERPLGEPIAKNLIPGLIFIEPYILTKITGVSFQGLESVFWSLYIEFKFYVIAAFLYFLLGRKKLVFSLFLCTTAWFFSAQLNQLTENTFIFYIFSLSDVLGFKYFGWFASGAAFYLSTKSEGDFWYRVGVVGCVISSSILAISDNSLVISDNRLAAFFAAIGISLLFAVSLVSERLQSMLSHKFLLFLGFISYPLYLLHENMMISIILKLSPYLPTQISFILPVFAICFISFISLIIVKYIEKPVKITLKWLFKLIALKTSKKGTHSY
jgi:peptidoglycan/LPS O-acetylase OafA/YrhL